MASSRFDAMMTDIPHLSRVLRNPPVRATGTVSSPLTRLANSVKYVPRFSSYFMTQMDPSSSKPANDSP